MPPPADTDCCRYHGTGSSSLSHLPSVQRGTAVLLAVLFPCAGPSEDGRRGWQIAGLLDGAGLPCDFSVSALCLEDDSAAVPWCMRTSGRCRVSAERPGLWRSYLKRWLFLLLSTLTTHNSTNVVAQHGPNPQESPSSLCNCPVKTYF